MISKEAISLTNDVWSLGGHRGYMVVTYYWIDPKWPLRSAILHFRKFPTLHTGNAANVAKGNLWEVMQDWNLQDRICAIKTEYA